MEDVLKPAHYCEHLRRNNVIQAAPTLFRQTHLVVPQSLIQEALYSPTGHVFPLQQDFSLMLVAARDV